MPERRFPGLREDRAVFQSENQNARALTEDWAERFLFCPNCETNKLSAFPANRPVADFYCESCGEQFELKSSKRPFQNKVVDGAHRTMIERLESGTAPNLVLMNYDPTSLLIRKIVYVPKLFFVPSLIEKRKPLAPTARRAGWVGCNIILSSIPISGLITYIDEFVARPRDEVRQIWTKHKFLEDHSLGRRGWLIETMKIVEMMPGACFSLDDVYFHEARLNRVFPNNKNIRPKLRQQLQCLRDMKLVEFLGSGLYRRID